MSRKSLEYYQSLEYNIIIKKEVMDGEEWYVAYCNEFGLPACHGIGNTQSEALNSFMEEKRFFIDFLYEKGEPIPEVISDETGAFRGVFTVRTSSWLHRQLSLEADNQGISLNSLIIQLLSYYLGQVEVSNKCIMTMHENKVEMKNFYINSLYSSNRLGYEFEDQKHRKADLNTLENYAKTIQVVS